MRLKRGGDGAPAELRAPSPLFVIAGALFAGSGVAAGAFAAHALKDRLTPEMLGTFETAVRYQTMHALALIAVALLLQYLPGRLAALSGWLFIVGIGVFSGSLYALCLSGERWFGALTPIGGIAFIAGWLCLVVAAWRCAGARR